MLAYERCHDHPWWLILLLLFLLLSLLSFSCCIVVRKQSAHDVPEAMYVQELEAPRPIEKPVVPAPAPRPAPKKPRKQPKPKKATKKKKPKKKPKNQKPRKWRTVATGHYIGSQGPMAVKWGKLGEVNTGERVVVGEEDSSSSESEQSSSDESVLSSSDESQHDSSDDEVDLPPLPALEIERPEQVSKQKIVEQRRCRCNTWQWLILAILLAAIVGTAIAIVVDENKRDSLDGDGTTESSRLRQLGTQLHTLLRGSSGRGGEE